MAFTLTVARYRGLRPERETSLPIPDRGCTLGRNPDNDLPLEDPERVISGCHARLDPRDGALWVTDQSTNGTFLNQSAERLPARQRVQVREGDTLTVGAYDLVVSTTVGAPAMSSAPRGVDPFNSSFLALDGADPSALPGLPAAAAAPDILDLLGAVPTDPNTARAPAVRPATDNNFADALALDLFLSGPAAPAEVPLTTPPPTPFEHIYVRPPEIAPTTGTPTAPPAPEEYDLLADLRGAPAPDPFAFPDPEDPFAAPRAAAPPAFVEEPQPGPAAPVDPRQGAAGVEPEATEPTASPMPVGTEPSASRLQAAPSGDIDNPLASAVPTVPENAEASDKQSSAVPAPVPPAPPPRPVASVAAPPTSTAEPGAGLGAFLAGLGTGSPEAVADAGRLLLDAGRLLRELTQGLTATMLARAQFKSELRLGVTTIRAAENNPYKFSVGANEALDRLLFRPGPGYLPATEAARGAFEDIQAHEMAMIAGLRAALRALLARFEPTELERRLGAASGLDKLMPMNRKARYWDLFTETYEQVAADAAEDFMELFGDAFTRAYEDQIDRLARARAQSRGAPAGKQP
ncbi:MAG TPA: type VI secretion system-associated FHA domain protein TagH [Lamprocystis sp. (in: g-proteobacteria)]|nr:type VI secretion system-associated FHA domain protein TagH [Lamprocystis sp. (in: g-proteobacteria)]